MFIENEQLLKYENYVFYSEALTVYLMLFLHNNNTSKAPYRKLSNRSS